MISAINSNNPKPSFGMGSTVINRASENVHNQAVKVIKNANSIYAQSDFGHDILTVSKGGEKAEAKFLNYLDKHHVPYFHVDDVLTPEQIVKAT